MAITGVSSISGQQIIAAGTLSAASAGTALFDENGNAITSYLTAVPTGYTTSGDVTGTAQYGLTTAGWSEITGGGSAPTYSYTDNDLISAIDSSGLYATSALEAESANVVKDHGTLGFDLSSYLTQNTSYFYWMPSNSPWTTADYATGIFSPLQYATGACLAMNNPATFKAYYKGNEWFIANTVNKVGQMLRGEVHQSRGVHISGATTAGDGFDLNINGVSGVNFTGSWKYGHAEDSAVRTISAKLDTSAFSDVSGTFLTGLPIDISVRDLEASRHVRATNAGQDIYGNFDNAGMYFRSGSQRPYNIGIDNTGSNFYIATAKTGFERIYASSIQSWNRKQDASAMTAYQETSSMTAYQPVGDYLTTADSANFYTTANESGFINEVPAGTMNESAFGYDASDNITGYNGSAFKAGDEFPQSAAEAIEAVTANSGAWNSVSAKLDTSAFALSALNDANANNIILTASLPVTPDANTLYLIPEV